MRSESARVTLRQLCRLGLAPQWVLPALLPVIRELVPASHAAFFFCDERGTMTNLYAERLLAPGEMASFHDRYSDPEFRRQYLQRVNNKSPVTRRSVEESERHTSYYKDVLVPLGIEHFLYAIVRHEQRVLGQLSLYRGVDGPAFSAADAAELSSLLHYLGAALSNPSPHPLAGLQDQIVEEALAVFSAEGKELFCDAHWPRLIRMAHCNQISPATALAEREQLPKFVDAILRSAQASALSVVELTTTWGRFAFHLTPVASPSGAAGSALRISRLAAEPLRLTQGAAALSLPPRQREVAVLMAQGYSNQTIAKALNITINTASYHAKQVMARLSIHDRSDVARMLSRAAKQ